MTPAHALETTARSGSDLYADDIALVGEIASIQTILDVVCQSTGMGFAAVARVTGEHWVACAVLDNVGFGIGPGDELPIATTLCDEVRASRNEIVIDAVADDPDYAGHHTPRIYGLQSYISVPIVLSDGSFFGTLCAIDPKPAKLTAGPTVPMFRLFAQMIARHIDDRRSYEASRRELSRTIELGALREEFIAVLGHDLRNPLAAMQGGTRILLAQPQTPKAERVLGLMRQTADRMASLVDNLLDFARGRLGEGLTLDLAAADIPALLDQLAGEVRAAYPDRVILSSLDVPRPVVVDRSRIGQMVGNLLGNAVVHGSPGQPIHFDAGIVDGELRISVSNGGEPIAPDARARLFQPFAKGDSTGKGLGLGLYIASEIAAAHGGRITVESDRDETRFTFTMPAGPEG